MGTLFTTLTPLFPFPSLLHFTSPDARHQLTSTVHWTAPADTVDVPWSSAVVGHCYSSASTLLISPYHSSHQISGEKEKTIVLHWIGLAHGSCITFQVTQVACKSLVRFCKNLVVIEKKLSGCYLNINSMKANAVVDSLLDMHVKCKWRYNINQRLTCAMSIQ